MKEEEIKLAPPKPGVYIMKDAGSNILYVGKAVNLRNRIKTYFPDSKFSTKNFARKVENIEYILTDSESEALILENNLIKKYHPKYNVKLRDDKTYPYLKITTNEKYPRMFITRRISLDSARYFGPYASAGSLRKTLKIIQQLFPIATCKKKIKKREIPCLEFHINRCVAPCVDKIKKEEYQEIVNQIIDFLEGKDKKIVKKLSKEMKEAAENLNFEKAKNLRDKIKAIEKILFSYPYLKVEPEMNFHQHLRRKEEKNVILTELQKFLNLPLFPARIECYDISNISGKEATGSLVVFENGLPLKSNYRRFRIKTVSHPDDYAMLEEVIKRRFSDEKLLPPNFKAPDLIIVDGGKGQLNTVYNALIEVKKEFPVISIAKSEEKIFLRDRKDGILLPSYLLHLVQQIRDEAHRFAISYHRKLRSKKIKNA